MQGIPTQSKMQPVTCSKSLRPMLLYGKDVHELGVETAEMEVKALNDL